MGEKGGECLEEKKKSRCMRPFCITSSNLADRRIPYFCHRRWVRYICNRGKTLDKWCQQFLDIHRNEPVQVIHLGCGLDSRNLRVRWTDRNVRWYDIDLPVVCDLRRRVMPLPPTGKQSEYSLRSLSVMEEGWFRDIPSDRLTMIVCEALIFYFSPAKAQKLIHDVVEYFGGGQFAFDAVGSLSIKYKPTPFKKTPLSAKWGIDDARQIEKFHPKLKMTGRIRWEDYLGNEASLGQSAPPIFGPWTQAMLSLKNNAIFREALQVLRFDFGDRARSAASSELGPFSAVSVLEFPLDSASETGKEG